MISSSNALHCRMLIPTLKVAASAVVATLATSSARNMLQTSRLVRSHDHADCLTTHVLGQSLQTVETAVESLQSLPRKEVVHLFLSCEAPSIDQLQGEWDGALLANNRVLVCVITVPC